MTLTAQDLHLHLHFSDLCEMNHCSCWGMSAGQRWRHKYQSVSHTHKETVDNTYWGHFFTLPPLFWRSRLMAVHLHMERRCFRSKWSLYLHQRQRSLQRLLHRVWSGFQDLGVVKVCRRLLLLASLHSSCDRYRRIIWFWQKPDSAE